jgi:hypothetical protein
LGGEWDFPGFYRLCIEDLNYLPHLYDQILCRERRRDGEPQKSLADGIAPRTEYAVYLVYTEYIGIITVRTLFELTIY